MVVGRELAEVVLDGAEDLMVVLDGAEDLTVVACWEVFVCLEEETTMMDEVRREPVAP